MTDDPRDPERRALLLAAAVAVPGLAVRSSAFQAPAGKGAAGDFDFLAGEWKIRHRRPKKDAPGAWDEFDGEATCWTVLGGTGSVEELRIPARDFSGLGIRLLNPKTLVWHDYWVNGKAREVGGGDGLTGVFLDGVGTFTAEDDDNGTKIVVRGVWDRITPRSHRWRQGLTSDGGKTWVEDWFMDWTRVR